MTTDFVADLSAGGKPRRVRRNHARLATYAVLVLFLAGTAVFRTPGASALHRVVAGTLNLGIGVALALFIDDLLYGRSWFYLRVDVEGMASGRLVMSLHGYGGTFAWVRTIHWTVVRDGHTNQCRTMSELYEALGADCPAELDSPDWNVYIDQKTPLPVIDLPPSALARVTHLSMHSEYSTAHDDRYALDAVVPETALARAARYCDPVSAATPEEAGPVPNSNAGEAIPNFGLQVHDAQSDAEPGAAKG